MENTSVSEGKTAAIIAYLTIIGTVIAFIMNSNKKNYFTSFHIRQMIGIVLLGFINKYIIYDFLGSRIGWVVGVLIFVLWIIGFIGAIKGEEKEVPVVGEHFQNWFRNI